ncbi:Chromosome partition protein Smc [uncultured Gammaproteobacteria bacterium]
MYDTSSNSVLDGNQAPALSAISGGSILDALTRSERLWPMLIGLSLIAVSSVTLLSYQSISTRSEFRDTSMEQARLKSELDVATKKATTLQTELLATRTELTAAKQERTQKEIELQRINGEVAALSGRRSTLTNQLTEQARLSKDTEHKMAVAVQQRNRCELDLETARSEIGSIQGQLATVSAQLKQAQTKIPQPRPAKGSR